MQSAKPTSDVVILVVFLPGEDLINAEKQTESVQWRGCCGVRTVALWTHPPVGRMRSCGKKKKSKQEPWMGLFNPAVNPRPYLPTTSHYLCTTFSPHTAERTHAHAVLCGSIRKGWTGAARAAACCSRKGQKNENHRVHRAITETWTLDGLCSHSQMKILCWSKGTMGLFLKLA